MRWLALVLALGCSGDPAAKHPLENHVSPKLEPRPEDHGSIEGVVADLKTGELLAGVTVTAATQVTGTKPEYQSAITDEHGVYKIAVAPGDYLVTFYYAELTIERPHIRVSWHAVTTVSLRLPQ